MARYFAKRTFVPLLGREFHSQAEANRAVELEALRRAGKVHSLEFQPRFDLVVEGVRVGHYVGDFAYWDVEKRQQVIEDVKPKSGYRSDVYRLKKRLMLACHSVEISEHEA